MKIYIDEAGAFLAPRTQPFSYSLVLALIVPSALEDDLFYEFLRLRDTWPAHGVEVKGSSLDESQAAGVVDLAVRYDLLVEFAALDMATHPPSLVDEFKARQAEAVTAHVTLGHHPDMVSHLERIARTIHNMSNQLFLQSFVTIELVFKTIQTATLYFVQRQPKELGDIALIIDRKNRTLTQMEETWATLILPMSEAHFAKKPLTCIIEADYSHFDERYGFTAAKIDEEMARHLEWMRTTYRVQKPPGDEHGIDAKRLLSEQRSFMDSRDLLGLQLADMLASILRRALNNRLQAPGWRSFGQLLVRKASEAPFMQLGAPDPSIRCSPHAIKVWNILESCAKSMFTEDSV